MADLLYRRGEYIIVRVAEKDGFIVINTKKEFEKGHTHMKSFKKSKSIIDLMFLKKVPRNESIRFLYSLIRVSDDKEYQEKVQELIDVKKQKGKKQNYYNRQL